jgi:tetratricopeptide (TPR) repeat protein
MGQGDAPTTKSWTRAMRTSTIFFLGLVGMTLGAGTCTAQPAADPSAACSELLDKGKRFLGNPDREVYALGLEKLRQAERLCQSPQVPPALRARVLMLTTDLYSGDRERQREMWTGAISLLRAEAPNSRLLPRAIEGLASVEFSLGNYDESVRLATEALDQRRRLFGEESRDYVRGLTFVAGTYLALTQIPAEDSNSRQALPYAEQAYTTARKLFGLRDGTTVTAAAMLIEVLKRRGLATEADRLQEEIRPYLNLMDLEDPME